jgi:hypothetical protein
MGFKGLFALSAFKSAKRNLVLVLNLKEARDFTYQQIDTLQTLIGFRRILEDDSCHKVVIHGISTEDFSSEDSLEQIRFGLERFNKGLKLTTDPIWLTTPTKRQEQQGASILVTFQSEAEAKRAIQYRLFIRGVSVRAELARDKSKATSQGA